jgi:signal transduction histidine kinase
MNFIAPWVILAPVSGFLLVGIRSGVFWSVAAMLLVTMMFGLQWVGVSVPNFVDPANTSFLDFFSLSGFIGYVVFILLNNDLSKMRLLNALREVQAAMEGKNREITAINHTLENTVAKRTEKLLAANEELDTFLYESSHALRRPLMRILGLMSLVETERDPAEKAQYMELMSYTAHNMDKMLQDLLLVSEVYKKELVAQGADLGMEVRHLIGLLQSPDVTFVEEIPKGLRLPLDVELLQMILKKLLDNAVFYRRRDVAHTVKVTAQSQDRACVVCIEDNGIGIDPVAIPQLFKMFARGSERSRGSGLGLFIVAKAMDRLGGRVWIESEKGLRTAIYLAFPTD